VTCDISLVILPAYAPPTVSLRPRPSRSRPP